MRTEIVHPLKQTAAGARAEAVLRACVHCGMCNAACPTYRLTGDELDGPRGRIYLIKQALEGGPVTGVTRAHLDRCLGCRACETACPSGVEYHRLLDVGRERVSSAAQRPALGRFARWGLRRVSLSRMLPRLLAVGRNLHWAAPSRLARLIPPAVPIGSRPPTGHEREMLLLGGCVQRAAAPHFNAAARRVFDHLGVGLTETPGCCGAVSFHLDAPDDARRLARLQIDAWTRGLDDGAEAIVVTASGCAAFIRDWPDFLADEPNYAERARRVVKALRDPLEILDGARLQPARSPVSKRIAVHDPCTLRNGPGLAGTVERLLARLGYDPQPVADADQCCGSAGPYALLQPEFARLLRSAKLAALGLAAPETIYTANIGCWLHLGAESTVPVRHWIEAVDDLISPP